MQIYISIEKKKKKKSGIPSWPFCFSVPLGRSFAVLGAAAELINRNEKEKPALRI